MTENRSVTFIPARQRMGGRDKERGETKAAGGCLLPCIHGQRRAGYQL